MASPQTVLVTGEGQALRKKREAVLAGGPHAIARRDAIVRQAERAIRYGPLTVTAKTRTPPSGDKRDYLSLAPYWWPDPLKKNGLPWVRKDGRVNPETRGEHVDVGTKARFFSTMEALGEAAYLTGEAKYGKAGAKFLFHWFVNPDTRMNPNLKYAQAIPGRSEGRAAGIIEWCGIDSLLSSIQILRALGYVPRETDVAIGRWFSDYATWLQTSDIGKDEAKAKNNHGTWYDAQLVAILLFLEREDEAKRILDTVTRRRIAGQIEPDGRQPHELARTKSLSYSKMNLRAFIKLADHGKRPGVDLWNYETSDGRSIRKAREFLEPYVEGEKKWPYRRITGD